MYTHEITVEDENKFGRKTYPIPIHYQKQVDSEISIMLKNNIIERSTEKCDFKRTKIKFFGNIISAEGIYVLKTDASDRKVGRVLHQQDADAGHRVISYVNLTMQGAENYFTTEKEILAIVYVLKKYSNYLCGRHF